MPLRGIKEYRFVYGDNTPQVGQGDGDSKPGQVIGQAPRRGDGPGAPGDRPGIDYYETDITLDELVDLMFEDLELPDLERKALRETVSQTATKRQGYRKVGIHVQLDKRRTMRSRIRRKLASGRVVEGEEELPAAPGDGEKPRFPFHQSDLRFRRRSQDVDYESNAVVLCIMDTSGSMNTMKKYLARSFFFLLYQFVHTRYIRVELVFIAHDTLAREVGEDDFFHKGESGGTMISSGYAKALEIIDQRYHPSLWNVYAFHCSDGDNVHSDIPETLKLARALCKVCNLFGYGEIKPSVAFRGGDTMLAAFKALGADNFQAVAIADKGDVWTSFKSFLTRDRAEA